MNVISVVCVFAEYYFGARPEIICVSIILIAILVCLFQIWNRLESIRFMIAYRFDKVFLRDGDD